jgi:hypothetical protein
MLSTSSQRKNGSAFSEQSLMGSSTFIEMVDKKLWVNDKHWQQYLHAE